MIAVETDELAKAWEEFDEKARSAEPPYEKAALAQFESESDAVVRMIESNVPSRKALGDLIALAVDWPFIEAAVLGIAAAYSVSGRFYRQWYNRFRPLVAKTMAQSASNSAINRRVTRMVDNVTRTTRQQIKDVVAAAQAEGVGVNVVTRRIRDEVFGGTITKARATAIARTETVGALNEGAMLRAR